LLRKAIVFGGGTPGSPAPQRAAATAAAGHRGCCATSEPGYRPAATPPMRSQAMQAAPSCVHTRSDSASSQGTFVHEKRNSDSWKDIAFSIVGGELARAESCVFGLRGAPALLAPPACARAPAFVHSDLILDRVSFRVWFSRHWRRRCSVRFCCSGYGTTRRLDPATSRTVHARAASGLARDGARTCPRSTSALSCAIRRLSRTGFKRGSPPTRRSCSCGAPSVPATWQLRGSTCVGQDRPIDRAA